MYAELFARGNVAEQVFDLAEHPQPVDHVSGGMTCQIVRSGSPWALGQVYSPLHATIYQLSS